MQFIKSRAYKLAVLGKSLDDEDLIEKVLDSLDDDYKSIVDIINGRDTLISFDELHEKLINKELSLKLSQSSSSPLPATANLTNTRTNSGNFRSSSPRPPWVSFLSKTDLFPFWPVQHNRPL